MRRSCLLIVFGFCLSICPTLFARPAAKRILTAGQAKDHVGEVATVCGRVVSSHYAYRSRGRPTFLDFDRPYPNQIFVVVIWGKDRAKFGRPEERYRDKRICATGLIRMYRGVPETIARTPNQIEVK